MKKLIVANWKMNPASQKEALELFDAVKSGVENSAADVVICPPFVYLPLLKGMALGAQNISLQEKGAFTSQISAAQLKDLGVEYVIVGHSESRKNLHETDEEISLKIKAAQEAGLKVVLCVGENEGEDKNAVLEKQLAGISNVIIAYEPIWAIGTGKNCGIEETKASVALIKKILGDETVMVLYGGSVKAENASDYLKNGEVDGLLVGGASLDAQGFTSIVKSADA